MTVELVVSDAVVAKLVAAVAVRAPGVARLQPTGARAALTRAAELLRARTASPVDVNAIDVVRDQDGLHIAIRLVATGSPTVLAAVEDVHRRVAAELTTMAGVTAVVVVDVLDVDPR